jgi:SsrA-binding protein
MFFHEVKRSFYSIIHSFYHSIIENMKEKIEKNIEIKNRRASFEYAFLEKYTAGVMLKGTEIKSIRQGKVNLTDAYCLFLDDELYIRQMNISKYNEGTHYNHEPLRDRKLLLTKRELKKLQNKLKDVGLTIVPTFMYISDRGFAKIDIALAKGKKLYDKRDSIKEKDVKRSFDRGMIE